VFALVLVGWCGYSSVTRLRAHNRVISASWVVAVLLCFICTDADVVKGSERHGFLEAPDCGIARNPRPRTYIRALMESLKELTAKNTNLTSALRESIAYKSTAKKGIKKNALEHAL